MLSLRRKVLRLSFLDLFLHDPNLKYVEHVCMFWPYGFFFFFLQELYSVYETHLVYSYYVFICTSITHLLWSTPHMHSPPSLYESWINTTEHEMSSRSSPTSLPRPHMYLRDGWVSSEARRPQPTDQLPHISRPSFQPLSITACDAAAQKAVMHRQITIWCWKTSLKSTKHQRSSLVWISHTHKRSTLCCTVSTFATDKDYLYKLLDNSLFVCTGERRLASDG